LMQAHYMRGFGARTLNDEGLPWLSTTADVERLQGVAPEPTIPPALVYSA
jgi:hypothetical protein